MTPSLKLAVKAIMAGRISDARGLVKRCIHLKLGDKLKEQKAKVNSDLNTRIQDLFRQSAKK